MRNTKKAFTLVELIVVITILAILGTIAFISLQGYSSDARNSKRTSDIGNIISGMSIKVTEGISLLSFIADSDNALVSANVAGTGTTNSNYNAGNANYQALAMKTSEFQDPNGDDYVIGVTTNVGGQYQVAASIETGGGSEKAKLQGNFVSRLNTGASNIYDATGNGDTVTLTFTTDVNKLTLNDTIFAGTSTGVIKEISADGLTYTLDITMDAVPTNIILARTDTTSLIAVDNTTGSGTPVTEGGTNLPY